MFQLILKAYQESGRDVRFGSKADMCSALADVRFVPIADIATFTRSLRQLPRDAIRYGDAKCLGSFEIDY